MPDINLITPITTTTPVNEVGTRIDTDRAQLIVIVPVENAAGVTVMNLQLSPVAGDDTSLTAPQRAQIASIAEVIARRQGRIA